MFWDEHLGSQRYKNRSTAHILPVLQCLQGDSSDFKFENRISYILIFVATPYDSFELSYKQKRL